MRISDLQFPVPTPAHRRALKNAERAPVRLTEDAILSAARREAGLDDFGPDDFKERLRRWLQAANAEPDRTALGRSIVFESCVRFAVTRLRLENLLSRHPEIHKERIRQPIIILGPPRSGTTHLHGLLATDDRLRALPDWECHEPLPAKPDTVNPNTEDPRHARHARRIQQRYSLLPYLPAFAPQQPDYVGEDFLLQGPDFAMALREWVVAANDHHDYDTQDDQTPHYAYMKTMLKALQWQRGTERWILKTPAHAAHIGALLEHFPDAIVVITHRDPVSVIQSVSTMWAYVARLHHREVNTIAMGEKHVKDIEALLQAIVRDRALIPAYQRHDVLFHQFVADETKTLKDIYAKIELELTDRQLSRAQAFLTEHSRLARPRIAYDLQTDFHLDPDVLRARFAFYYQQIPVKVEQI